MIALKLDFTQRMKITSLLEIQEGPLGITEPYHRALKVIRFSEAENRRMKRVPAGRDKEGRLLTQFILPEGELEFGNKKVEVETEDGIKLLELLKGSPLLNTMDHDWADPVLEQLEDGVRASKRGGSGGGGNGSGSGSEEDPLRHIPAPTSPAQMLTRKKPRYGGAANDRM